MSTHLILQLHAENEGRLRAVLLSIGAAGASPLVWSGTHVFDPARMAAEAAALDRALTRAIRRGASGAAADEALAAHGRALFDEGLPGPVKTALRAGPAALTVFDAALHLPWPTLHDGRGFLGRSLALGELLSGTTPAEAPPNPSDRLLVVADPAGDLPAARYEGEALVRALARVPGSGVDLRPGRLSVADFLRLFAGARLVHFAGHADAPGAAQPGRAAARGGWRLGDGHVDAMQLARLAGGAAPGLVFANACRSAVAAEAGALTLAEALVTAGVQHVISATVDVPDLPGAELAVRFHQALRAGASVGEALRRARLETPSAVWAAYRLHGDPTSTYFEVDTRAAPASGARHAVALAARLPTPRAAAAETFAERSARDRGAFAHLVAARGGQVLAGHGAVLRAVFGLPVGYENDAERAAEAALAAASRWPEAVLVLDAGPLVSLGEAGQVAGEALARAEAAAWSLVPGVFALAGARGRLSEQGRFGAAGGQGPWQLLGLTGVATHAPMVGRATELARLDAAVAEVVRRGRGLAVTVVGPAGMGKSRLVEALAERLMATAEDPAGVRVLRGSARAYDTSLPFAAAAGVLRALLAVHADDPPATVRDALDAFITGAEAALPIMADDEVWSIDALVARPASGALWSRRPALLRALGFTTDGAEDAPSAVPAAVAQALTTAAAARPTVVIFEDVHWLPPAGRAVVEAVAEAAREAPLVVVCTTRPALDAAPLVTVDQVRIDLGPLDEGAARALLDPLLPPTVAAAEREAMLQRADGNPLFIRELARALEEPGMVVGAVPPTVEAVVRARVDRLPEAAQAVLGAAAVFGRTFWLRGLARLLDLPVADGGPSGRDGGALGGALDALVRLGFVAPAGDEALGEPDSWRFVNSLVRDVVYQGLAARVRTALHARAALWLASEVAGPAAARQIRVAEHRAAAGDWARAAEDWVAAATALASGDTPGELRAALEAALAADAEAGGSLAEAARARVQTTLAEVRRTEGELDAAATLLDATLAAHRSASDPARVERLRRRAELDEVRGELQGARRWLAQAVAELEALAGTAVGALAAGEARLPPGDHGPALLAGSLDLRGLAVDLERDRAWLDHRDGGYEAVIARLAPVLPDLPPEAAVQVASVANVLGLAFYALGDDARAEACHRQSLAAAETCGRSDRLRAACNNLGLLALRRGDHDGAARWFGRVVQIYARLGDRDGLAIAYNNLGALAGERGDYGRAARYLEESIRIRARAGHAGLALGYANLGEAIFKQGDLGRARHFLVLAIDLCEAGKGPGYLLPDALRMLAELTVAEGQPTAAVPIAERALALARASKDAPRAAVALRALAEAQAASGATAAAHLSLDAAVEALTGLEAPRELARAHAARARLLAVADPSAAAAAAAEADAVLARLGS